MEEMAVHGTSEPWIATLLTDGRTAYWNSDYKIFILQYGISNDYFIVKVIL